MFTKHITFIRQESWRRYVKIFRRDRRVEHDGLELLRETIARRRRELGLPPLDVRR